MEFDGYMIKVWWDGTTLRIRGSNKAARVALAGRDHDQDVVLPRSEIAEARLKNANPLTNGNLIIRTSEGRKYQLHFRRKHQQDFERLAEELGTT